MTKEEHEVPEQKRTDSHQVRKEIPGEALKKESRFRHPKDKK
jgi:hypothetical protein